MASVCDHAAWLAGRLGVGIELLHVEEAGAPPDAEAVIDEACARLAEQGAELLDSRTAHGPFAPVAASLAGRAEAVVLGRRGGDSGPAMRGFGANVGELLRLTEAAVLVATRTFLPISRAILLPHRLDVAGPAANDGALNRILEGLKVEVVRTPMLLARPEDCLADLLVVSKSVFLESSEGSGARLADQLSRLRVPLLAY
jgi:hypothetical protein